MMEGKSAHSLGWGPRTDLRALDAEEPYDVCVIGSGPAGTILASSLVRKGVRTLLIESGLGIVKWFTDPRLKELARYEFTGDTQYPLTHTSGRLLGGNSNFWTGRCERFQPSDFESHPYSPPENPWPIAYADLETYYTRAENTLRVRGGKLSQYMPPRSADLPIPPRPDITALKHLLARADVVLDDSPTATPEKSIRFFRVQKELLPEFLDSGFGTLVCNATAVKLIANENGRVIGAEVSSLDGVRKVAKARAYVVACGGIQTPRLLLLSRSQRFPNGIGNNHDQVGRGFNEHPGVNIYCKISHSGETLVPRHKVGRTHQFYEMFRPQGLGAIHPVFIQSWVFPHHLLRYRLIDVPKYLFRILGRVAHPTLYGGATIEMRPQPSNRVTLSETETDIFGNPLAHLNFSYSEDDLRLLDLTSKFLRSVLERVGGRDPEQIEVTWSRHHISTCRMGTNESTSVVDKNLRVHGCQNLYLCGSEVFVTGSPVPPVLTIAAFAHRLGDHLSGLFQRCDESVTGL